MFRFTRYFCTSKIQAEKYIRSVSQQALLFKPNKLRTLGVEEVAKNRVVKEFFDKHSSLVTIRESEERLNTIAGFSSPSHSYLQITIPFGQQPDIRQKFVRFYTSNVRAGRLLELMDYMAAQVGYRYCLPVSGNNKPIDFSIVTASVDHINFFKPVRVDQNCTFSAYATYVGKTSIEVQVNVEQTNEVEKDHPNFLNCTATFVMVALGQKKETKYTVPTMNLEGESNIPKIRYQYGFERQIKRKEAAKKSLTYTAPSSQESSHLHELFLNKSTGDSIPIKETAKQKTLLMHLQDRNLHGKVFGGFLMREAFELGWLCAYMFLKGQAMPEIYYIDNIQFIQPVEIGSAVKFSAVVSFTERNLVHVTVQCEKVKPTGQKSRTNVLRLCFSFPQDVKKVHPQTYNEAMLYLESRRGTVFPDLV